MVRRRPPSWDLDADLAADLSARGELQTLVDLVAQSTLWVDPRVARAVPVLFTKTARVVTGKNRVGDVVDGIRLWSNQPPKEAVFRAMGLVYQKFRGATVCHVYPGSPRLPGHYTRLANLFVIATPLAAFTEWDPIFAAVRWRAFELYGYRGPSGRPPQRPALLPSRWASPAPMAPDRLASIVAWLEYTRRT